MNVLLEKQTTKYNSTYHRLGHNDLILKRPLILTVVSGSSIKRHWSYVDSIM